MPLTRYQIRNEYSLADPELYKAADKDDPEALLEGVAMAGLVGVLRQLGDLAEFAAEIFHDLHEEVLATAARGHGLMVRVQQLEVEFPSIEKAFLSQTNHSLFFSNTGVEWHPNLRMEQNLITRGDLPRCVMDSYEECRGPPRLFLLDKFDVAGAGACLKRYTDPSFFKVEPAVEVQREKKVRKVKKKGSRWRNGETPEVGPTSHAKLHQLFLEEAVEKGHSDPARLVKLRKRQLNAPTLDSRPGKSYMEKFLETPEHNVVREISVTPLALKLTSDNSSESGLDLHDITTVSPVKKSSQGKESTCSSPNSQEVILKPSMDELYGEVIDRQVVKKPEPCANGETDEIPSLPHKMIVEKEIVVDGEGKMDSSVDGDNSDDMTSEVDNYVDALTTMESEMETDNEYRPKPDLGFLNVEKCGMDSDRNEEQLESGAQFSDSLSIGNFSASDDGSSSFKKRRSSFSYSDTLSNLAENTVSDGEGSAKVFPSSEAFEAEIPETPSNQLSADAEVLETKSHDLVLPKDVNIVEDNACDLGEASSSSCLVDSNPTLLPFDLATSSLQQKLDETPSECMKPGSESSCIEEIETNLVDSSAVVPDVPSQMGDGAIVKHCAEDPPVDNLDGGDPSDSSVALLHSSNNSELAHEKKSRDDSPDEVIQTDFAEENCSKNLVHIKIDSTQTITSPREEQFTCLAMPKGEVCADFTSLPDSSNVVKPNDLVSEVDDVFPETGADPEISTSRVDTSETFSFKDQQVSNIEDYTPGLVLDSTEKTALYSEVANFEDISRTVDRENVGAFACKVDAVERDDVLPEIPSSCTDRSILGDHDNLDVVAESVQVENMVVSTDATDDVPAATNTDDDVDNVACLPQDLIYLSSSNLVNLQESPFGTENPDQEGLEFDEPLSPECLGGSETGKEINEVSPKDFDSDYCKLVSYDNSNSKMVDHDSSLADYTQTSMPASDVTIVPASSGLSDQEPESECLHQNHLLKDEEDATSSPAGHLPFPEIYFEQSQELQTGQQKVESTQAEEPSFNSSSHLSELIQCSNHMVQERLFNGAESCKQGLPSQPSHSDYLAQSTGQEINSAKQAMDPLGSILPSFGLLHEANQVNLEEVPPLPPLPPMQWRLGKIQHAPLVSQRESIGNSQESFLSILPFRDDEKAQIGFQDQQRGIVQSGNPFLPLPTFEIEKLHISEQEIGNTVQPTTASLQTSTMINDANNQQNSLDLEGTRSLNPFLTLSALPDEKADRGFLASEGEAAQLSSNPFLSVAAGSYTATKPETVSSQEKLVCHQNQLVAETGLEHKALQPTSQNSEGEHGISSDTSVLPPKKLEELPQFVAETGLEGKALQPTSQNSEGEHGIPSDTSVLPPRKLEEQPQHNLPTSEGESAWLSNPYALLPNYEAGNVNGSSTVKLPRPRNPLIDAVAALDKSKLRKVTERVRPQNGPKLDERDFLLEQIRSKSFNLKPAVVSRPSIQGPKTNLRVAAILEKANAIRQATAGSDEDDDEDGWSDS